MYVSGSFPAKFKKSIWLFACCLEVLRKKSIDYVVAPFEADAELAFLCKNNHIDAVVAEDSDLLAFGCSQVKFSVVDIFICNSSYPFYSLSNESNYAHKYCQLQNKLSLVAFKSIFFLISNFNSMQKQT